MDNDTVTDEGALQAKVVALTTLFVISMTCGCLPMLISLKFDWFTSAGGDLRSSNRLIMGLLSFGGGILFATTFLHLLPEVEENIELLEESGDISDSMPIHLSTLIMCLGFFMMYFIEEMVHVYMDHRKQKEPKISITRALSIRKSDTSRPGLTEIGQAEMQSKPSDAGEDSCVAALRGLLIVLALSIHELFEGLAVGLESSAANVWYMYAAVSSHKHIIAFCIGVELLAARTKSWLSVLYIFTFSFVSALGIGVGILLVGGAGAADAGLASVVLQGIACGTLVYVIFFEVWRQERSGMLQFLCSLSGFSLMLALEIIVELAIH